MKERGSGGEGWKKRFDELESLQPSGVYYKRRHKIDDYNTFWKAGLPIPENTWITCEKYGWLDKWVICDTGDDHVLLCSTKENVDEIFEIYETFGLNEEGAMYLYDPRDYDEKGVKKPSVEITREKEVRLSKKQKRRLHKKESKTRMKGGVVKRGRGMVKSGY